MFKSEQLQAVSHMYDGRDSYAITTWRARFTVQHYGGCDRIFCACTVCTRPLLVSRPGNEASQVIYMHLTRVCGEGGHQK